MKRRAMLVCLFATATASEAARLGVRAGRSGSPPPAPAPAGSIVPYSPLWISATPSSGQIAAVWQAPTQLWGGASISGDPVTSYRVRWGTTRDSVEVGASPTGSATTTSTNYTVTGLSSGAWWVSVAATNSGGESDASIPYQVTVP